MNVPEINRTLQSTDLKRLIGFDFGLLKSNIADLDPQFKDLLSSFQK